MLAASRGMEAQTEYRDAGPAGSTIWLRLILNHGDDSFVFSIQRA